MSYPRGRAVAYKSNVVQDLGAGVGTAWSFKGPKGKKGRIIDVGMHITETFTATTLAGMVLVGTAADPNYYAQLEMGLAADTDFWNVDDDPDAILIEALPADTQVEVTHSAPTGGTPAGIGWPVVVVEWYD